MKKEKSSLEYILLGMSWKLPKTKLGRAMINFDEKFRYHLRYNLTEGKLGSRLSNNKLTLIYSSLITSMGIFAYVGGYIGQGLGYVLGNGIDIIPLFNDFAPWIAERSGLIEDPSQLKDFNENFCETALGMVGVWKGFWLPSKYFKYLSKEERENVREEGYTPKIDRLHFN